MSFLSKNRITYNIRKCVYIEALKDNSFGNRMSFFDRKKDSCESVCKEGISVKSHLNRRGEKRK